MVTSPADEAAQAAVSKRRSVSANLVARFGDLIVDNPIFLRELRRRMRGKALFTAMIGYIGVMAGVAFFVVLVHVLEMMRSSAVNIMPTMSRMSDNLFSWIAIIQGILVLLVGPIITANIVSSEKDRHTLEFLQVTTLRPWQFIFGALASTMLYILLVLLCALPILSITFLFGGISPSDITASFGSLLLLSTILSAGALWISCLRERARSAQSALLFVIGIILLNFVLLRILTPRMLLGGMGGSALLPFSSLAPGGQINIFGQPISAWWADIGGSLLVIALLSLLGSRRVFHPLNRALCYWEGLSLFALAQLAIAAQFWGTRLTAATDIPRIAVGTWVLLLVMILVFNTSRVELGNEIWRLKRRFRFLRGIDESVLQILAMLGIWWIIGRWWLTNTAPYLADASTAQGIWNETFLFISIATLFACALARFFAQWASSRGAALRWSFLSFILLFIALPVVIIFSIKALDIPAAPGEVMTRLSLLAHTPWVYLWELAGDHVIRELGGYRFRTSANDSAPIIWGGSALLLFGFAWMANRRHPRPEYHFERREERRISETPYVHPEVFSRLRAMQDEAES